MAKLKLFAGIREAAGVRDADIEAETVQQLLSEARRLYGRAFSAQLDRATIAINGTELPKDGLDEIRIGRDDEIALLPPVSGGRTIRG